MLGFLRQLGFKASNCSRVMSYNCDRRGGYGDSAEEAANLFSTAAPTRNAWQVTPALNPIRSAGHHAGNTNCNGAGAADQLAAGAGQGAIIFQGFLGGRGYGGPMQPSSTGLHARWDLNPVQLGETSIQTSGNQRDHIDHHEQAKWIDPNSNIRLRGQLDDDELLGFSVDQRPAQQNLQAKSGPCTVVYKECQKNQALDSTNHCVDGCGEFMRRGRDGQEALQCMACGCHRSYHRIVRVGDNGKEMDISDPDGAAPRMSSDGLHLSLSRIESVALDLMEATGRALPLLAVDHSPRGADDLLKQELDTVMKISIENLDHISKVTLSTVECIGILHTAASTTQQSASSRDRPGVQDHGRLSSEVSPVRTPEIRRRSQMHELSPSQQLNHANHQQVDRISAPQLNAQNGFTPGKPKRKRTQFTDEQRGKMKAYAEHAGWTIVGQRKDNIAAACKDIGVTPKTLKYWIHNAKQKLKRSHEQPL